MPHVLVEYSANVADHVPPTELVAVMHKAMIANGIGPLAGLRTRAMCRDDYLVADDHPDNMFIAVTVRIGKGRDPQVRQACVADLMAALKNHLQSIVDVLPIALSVELQEIDPDHRINENNLRDHLAKRAEGGTDGE